MLDGSQAFVGEICRRTTQNLQCLPKTCWSGRSLRRTSDHFLCPQRGIRHISVKPQDILHHSTLNRLLRTDGRDGYSDHILDPLHVGLAVLCSRSSHHPVGWHRFLLAPTLELRQSRAGRDKRSNPATGGAAGRAKVRLSMREVVCTDCHSESSTPNRIMFCHYAVPQIQKSSTSSFPKHRKRTFVKPI